jgi:hypothetical protein
MPIRSRDHDPAVIPYSSKQPLKNHGISDIGDLEFIKTKNLRFMAYFSANLNERIASISGNRASTVKTWMDVQHEFVEMNASGRNVGCDCRGEEVGQARLASTDIAINVKATFFIFGICEGLLKSREAVHERWFAWVWGQSAFF